MLPIRMLLAQFLNITCTRRSPGKKYRLDPILPGIEAQRFEASGFRYQRAEVLKSFIGSAAPEAES